METLKETINNICQFNIVDTVIVILASAIIYNIIYKLFIKRLKNDSINDKISKKSQTYLRLTTNVLRYIFIVVALLVILQVNGVNVSSLLAGVGILGVIIGLAVQDALKDIIRGCSILSDEYFEIGDIILYKEITGKVIALRFKGYKDKGYLYKQYYNNSK